MISPLRRNVRSASNTLIMKGQTNSVRHTHSTMTRQTQTYRQTSRPFLPPLPSIRPNHVVAICYQAVKLLSVLLASVACVEREGGRVVVEGEGGEAKRSRGPWRRQYYLLQPSRVYQDPALHLFGKQIFEVSVFHSDCFHAM